MSVFNQSRSTVIRFIFLGIFVVIIAQLVNLQLISGKYKQLAFNNAVFPKVVYPSRGIIYDRKGKAILNNTIMFDLVVTPNQVKNIDTLLLCSLLQIDTAEFRRRMIDAKYKNGPYRPSVFRDLLPSDMYAKLDENMWKFPGFDLVERPVRVYPFNTGAQILGYIGEADSAIIKRSGNFYRLGDYVGRSGLEQYYESVLMGRRGVQYMLKDNKNRLVGKYENGIYDTAAIAGKNLRTYVDVEVQKLAEKLMKNKMGAIVALEPKTGGVIAMVSGPDFDPNMLTGPEKKANYSKLVMDASRPLFNRAIKGQYPPGSTYKPLGALIGLDEGVLTPKSGIGCTGAYYACSRPVKCTEHWVGHAANMRIAIAQSCNSFFSNAFRLVVDNPQYHNPRIGLTKWKEYANAFGYGHRTGIDLPSEDGGNIPDTAVYDKEYNRSWNSCTMVTMGIGQDKMLVTPLQIANAICIVANKGYYYTPHFVKTYDGEERTDTILNKYRKKHEVLTHISDSAYQTVIEGMHDVTMVGTAKRITKIPGIDICAKTGTAQNKKVINGKAVELKDHSVFVCFAPKDDPKIAVAVIVENGGFGATWAGPMAYLIVEKYLTDSLRADRLKEVERISSANLLPSWLPIEQFKMDSISAFYRFSLTNDSSLIRRFIKGYSRGAAPAQPNNTVSPDTNQQNGKPRKTNSNAMPVTQAIPMLDTKKIIHTKPANKKNESA